jgi:hypothetical protein
MVEFGPRFRIMPGASSITERFRAEAFEAYGGSVSREQRLDSTLRRPPTHVHCG